MKEFFGINLTADPKNGVCDGFIQASRTISEELEERMTKASEDAIGIAEDQAFPALHIPLALRVLSVLSGFGVLVMLALIVNKVIAAYGSTDTEIGPAEIYAAAKWFVFGAIILLVLWIVLRVVIHVKKKRIKDPARQEESMDLIDELDSLAKNELGVPSDAKKIDTLYYSYVGDNGENRIAKYAFVKYFTYNNSYFIENGRLCIADNTTRYEIPLSALRSLRIVPENGKMSSWTKDEKPNADKYKDSVTKKTDALGRVTLKSVCILTLEIEGEEYCIRTPAYEAPVIEKLTGLTAEA